jgi:ribonucleotide reductase beta subunit family protein with ferritin-like domain
MNNFALIYRYILRDEFRLNYLIEVIKQTKRNATFEIQREMQSKFFDFDQYAMMVVSASPIY